jgi:hypothetical protein
MCCDIKMRKTYSILVGKCEGKNSFGRSRRGCEENIIIYHKEMKCDDLDWKKGTSVRRMVFETETVCTIIDFLDIIHRPVFHLKTTFRRLDSVSVIR